MRFKAEMGTYSSVVGQSVHLIAPEGHFAGQVALLCQDDRLRDRETQAELLGTICDALNATHAAEAPAPVQCDICKGWAVGLATGRCKCATDTADVSADVSAERLCAWLEMGPTEMGDEPAIYMDNPTDGDPLVLATMKRVYREDMLHEALRFAAPQPTPETPAAMLDAYDRFMAGAGISEADRKLANRVAKAASFGSAAYEKRVDDDQGTHAMMRSILRALDDPLHPDLDYLRADPAAGALARAGMHGGIIA